MATHRRTALVTGASSGIGLELAKLLASDGFDLVLVARDRARLATLAQEISQESGASVRCKSYDLAKPGAVQALWDELEAEDLAIDVLANNAGVGIYGNVAQQDLRALESMLELNVTALVSLTRLAIPGMKTRRWGRILNVASIVGHQPAGPRMAAYYASKSFVLAFSRGLAVELAGSGVTVTTLSPGVTESRFEERSGANTSFIYRFLPRMSAVSVARAGYRAMKRGRTEVIPGFIPKILALAGDWSPSWLAVQVNRWLLSPSSANRDPIDSTERSVNS